MITLRFKRAEYFFAPIGATVGAWGGLLNVLEDRYSFHGALAHIVAGSLGTALWVTISGCVWRAIVQGHLPRRGAAVWMGLAMSMGGGLGSALSGALSASVNRPGRVLEDAAGTAFGGAVAGLICGPLIGAFIAWRLKPTGGGAP